MKKCKNTLLIKTWNKHSSELFDYEGSNGNKYETATISNGYIIRTPNGTRYTSVITSHRSNGLGILAYIDCDTHYFFYCSKFEDRKPNEQSWLNLKTMKNRNNPNASGYLLSQGDVIKIGRVRLKVRDINVHDKRISPIVGLGINSKKKAIDLDSNPYKHGVNDYIKRRVCRFCYSDEFEIGSPLISPCKCSGGLKYIHFSCLQQWLKTKAMFHSSVSNENCFVYQITQVKCEICMEPFPDFLREDGVLYEIFDLIECRFKNYISLESIPKSSNENKTIYIVGFDDKDEITIGRSHDTSVRIPEITVSRLHAKLIVNADKNLLYQDCGSKFGSLVLIQNARIKILQSLPLSIQIGQSLITMKMQRNMFFCDFSFFRKKKKSNIDYGTLNRERINVEKILLIKDHNKEKDNDKADCDNQSNNWTEENNKPFEENKCLEMADAPSDRLLLIKSNVSPNGIKIKASHDKQVKERNVEEIENIPYNVKTINRANISPKLFRHNSLATIGNKKKKKEYEIGEMCFNNKSMVVGQKSYFEEVEQQKQLKTNNNRNEVNERNEGMIIEPIVIDDNRKYN